MPCVVERYGAGARDERALVHGRARPSYMNVTTFGPFM
jgi:hypothetical protein